MDFKKELTVLINRHSLENGSDTPDFILADYLSHCLSVFDDAVKLRTKHITPTPPTALVECDGCRYRPDYPKDGIPLICTSCIRWIREPKDNYSAWTGEGKGE